MCFGGDLKLDLIRSGYDQISCSCGYAPANATQNPVCHPFCQGSLLTLIWLAVYQDLKVTFSSAPQSVPSLNYLLPPSCGTLLLAECWKVLVCPFLELTYVWNASQALKHISLILLVQVSSANCVWKHTKRTHAIFSWNVYPHCHACYPSM